MQLYQLAKDYQAVWQLVEDDTTDLAAIEDTLQSIEGAIEDKAANIVQFVRSLEMDAEVIKAEEQRLAARRKAVENRAKAIKQYLQYQMELAGIDKVKTPVVTLALQKNPPRVEITDSRMLPAQYIEMRVDYVPDKAAIKKALQAGEQIPGAKLEQGQSLRIR